MRTALRAIGGAALLAFALVAFTPLVGAVHRRLADPARLQPADAIVVLGAGVMKEGELSDRSLRRAVHGMRLMRRGLAPVVVFLGPRFGGVGEAEVRGRMAVELGVRPEAIVIEIGGETTRDEARRVRALLVRRGGRSVLLVTGVAHMARARGVFEREGMVVHAAPAVEDSALTDRPQSRLELARSVAQELIARAFYRLAGAL